MNLEDLYNYITNDNFLLTGDLDFVIKTKGANATVGPSHCTKIDGLVNGFDWDDGKLFVVPNKELIETSSALERAIKLRRKLLDVYAWDNLHHEQSKTSMTKHIREIVERELKEDLESINNFKRMHLDNMEKIK